MDKPIFNNQYFLGYCSCPPFECICNYQQMIPSTLQYNPHSPTYQQPQLLDSYWTQEPPQAQSYPDLAAINHNNYDFTNIPSDLFQPEEIFQLDQPIKPDFVQNAGDINRSPSTLLDLGSGTIHREFKSEEYWNQSINTMVNDDSNSGSSRFNLSQSPDHTLSSHTMVPPLPQNQYMESAKMDDIYGQAKTLHNWMTPIDTTDYSTVLNDNKVYFEENLQTFDSNFQSGKMYKNNLDLGQYPEYNNFLSVYDGNKTNDSTVFSELDFRINCIPNSSNAHYSHENFDLITHP